MADSSASCFKDYELHMSVNLHAGTKLYQRKFLTWKLPNWCKYILSADRDIVEDCMVYRNANYKYQKAPIIMMVYDTFYKIFWKHEEYE